HAAPGSLLRGGAREPSARPEARQRGGRLRGRAADGGRRLGLGDRRVGNAGHHRAGGPRLRADPRDGSAARGRGVRLSHRRMTFESSTARRGASSSLRGGFRRAALVGSGLALATLLVRLPARGAEPKERPIAVVDLHVDLPYRHNYRDGSFAESSGQFPARKLARAGVVGVVLPLFVPKSHAPEGPRFSDFETSYKGVLAEIRKTPPYLPPGCVETPGRVRTFLAFEGAGAFAEDPKRLDEWVGRGVRSLGLVHTKANALASSSGDAKPMPFGLTRAGKALVERAHRLRVPIDV